MIGGSALTGDDERESGALYGTTKEEAVALTKNNGWKTKLNIIILGLWVNI